MERIVKGIWKASLKNPFASIFMAQYLKSNKHANKLRRKAANRGKNIPPFLLQALPPAVIYIARDVMQEQIIIALTERMKTSRS